jgi:hypothetical protein
MDDGLAVIVLVGVVAVGFVFWRRR